MHVQLKRAKTLCAKRMQYLGGSEYSCYVDSNEVPLEKKVCELFIYVTACLFTCLVAGIPASESHCQLMKNCRVKLSVPVVNKTNGIQ